MHCSVCESLNYKVAKKLTAITSTSSGGELWWLPCVVTIKYKALVSEFLGSIRIVSTFQSSERVTQMPVQVLLLCLPSSCAYPLQFNSAKGFFIIMIVVCIKSVSFFVFKRNSKVKRIRNCRLSTFWPVSIRTWVIVHYTSVPPYCA